MVKTRNQTTQQRAEDMHTRSIPPGSQPRKVCIALPHTPILKKSHPTSAKKKRLSFAPNAPQEFHFEMNSPAVRRLRETTQEVHDSVILQEHIAQHGQCPKEIGLKEKQQYLKWLALDLQRTLKNFYFVECSDEVVYKCDVAGLQNRLKLAESLRRRVEIRRATSLVKLPHELDFGQLLTALAERRMLLPQASSAQVTVTYQQACEALERSILKEDVSSMVGEGYEFGRRRVSAADLIEYQNLTDQEMTEMLRERSSEGGGEPLPRRRADKLERLVEIAQREEEEEIRRLLRQELVLEAKRRDLLTQGEHPPRDLSALFHLVFHSQLWMQEYTDVDNTPIGDEHAACIVM